MNTAPRYEIVVTFPVYDNRDAICGTDSYAREMVYGTIPGAVIGARNENAEECSVAIFDIVEERKLTSREIDDAVARARGRNPFSKSFWSNSKEEWSDNIPF